MPNHETPQYHAQKKIKRYKEQDPKKIASYLEEIQCVDPSKIAYVDETGIDAYLHREYAYAKRGEKVIGHISGKKYRRVGIVAAQIGRDILAPLQYDGTMDSHLFEVWFENCLMCELPSDSVIVMDNAAFHRKKRLSLIVKNYGHVIIFLPPYAPEYNPIENFWAWLKAKLRNVLPFFDSFDDALLYSFSCI
jgi:transposase